jgi:Response receiver domain
LIVSSPGAAACLIARDFLQTVVIVDDQAELRLGTGALAIASTDASESDVTDVDCDAAVAGAQNTPDVATTPSIEAEPSSGLVEPSDDALSVAEHGILDAKTIINDFAQLGLVCGVIKPEQGEDIGPIVATAAARADVLVLDWWMHGDAGASSKAIIVQLANTDDQRDRVRLIIIYTAAQDLSNVAAEIAGHLPNAEIDGEKSNRIVAGSIHLVVLAKPGTEVDPSHAASVVSFEDFPERVVKEFAAVVEGVLSNVAFAALAAIRGNTHKILSRFDRTLDPAFLGHRMLLPDPEDAERHLVELILQEFSAVLESAAVGDKAGYEAIGQLVSDSVLAVEDIWKLSELATRNSITLQELAMRFLESGVSYPELGLSRGERKDIRAWAAKIFAFNRSESGPVASDVDRQWSMLMYNKLQYGDNCPLLRLGAVVRSVQTGDFMLCMQPVCDSVRLSGRTSFPFLLLEKTEGVSDIVLRYSGDYYLFNVRSKFRDLVMVPFEPSVDAAGVVKATRGSDDSEWQFMPAEKGDETLEWVAELRDIFSYKFSGRFAESISRVGTDDSELFRR